MGEFRYPRLIEQPVMRPHHCAVIPFLGASNSRGMFDTGTDYWGDRVYVSIEAAEMMATDLGWVSPADVRALHDRIGRLDDDKAALAARVAELEGQVAAVHTLRLAGATTTRKPGRPPKAEVAA